MKKLLAFLMAVTTCFCAFTACGKDDDDDSSKKEKASVSDDKDSDKDDKDSDKDDKDSDKDDKDSDKDDKDSDKDDKDSDKDDKDSDKDDKDSDKDDKDSDKDDKDPVDNAEYEVYQQAFQKIIDAAAADDLAATLRATLPDVTMDAIEKTESMDAITSAMGSISGMGFDKITSLEVVEVAECDAETVEKLEKLYSVYSNMFLVMEKQGLTYNDILSGNFDMDNSAEILEAANQLTQISDFENLDVDLSVKFDDAKFVTFSYNGIEEKTVAYKASGEDWKIDTIGLDAIGY